MSEKYTGGAFGEVDEETKCYFLTMNKIKSYLVIPLGMKDGVDELILHFLGLAKAYLRNAVDDFDDKYNNYIDFAQEADQWTLFYVCELYQNRNMYSQGTAPSFVTKSLLTSLQYFEGGSEKC